jgi:formate-dependent nitrite reductase membrane component NrfD
MHPTATERTPETFMWADVVPLHGIPLHEEERIAYSVYRNGPTDTQYAIRNTQGLPQNGPIHFGSTMAEHMVQVGYNAQHKIPWHWPVPAYLVTKGIGAGLFMLLSLGIGLNLFPADGLTNVVGGAAALLFIGLTTGFLVYDLERPERFLYILARPQWKSWLARGAVLLIGFTLVGGLWWLYELGAWLYGYDVPWLRAAFLWAGLPLALGTAVYTAFLFAQAEGRDLWQSPLLPFHLVVQAFMAGSGALLILDLFTPIPGAISEMAILVLVTALIIDLFVTLVGEFSIPHASEVAARAAHEISNGRYKDLFWLGSIGLGHIVPLLILLLGGTEIFAALAGLTAVIGLYCYEYAFVMAPQEIQNS